jgi:hypothetical protein
LLYNTVLLQEEGDPVKLIIHDLTPDQKKDVSCSRCKIKALFQMTVLSSPASDVLDAG